MIRFNSSDTPGSRPSITGQHPCTGRLRNGQANTVRPYPDSGKNPFRAPGIQIYDLKSKAPRPDTLHLHIRSAFATFVGFPAVGAPFQPHLPMKKTCTVTLVPLGRTLQVARGALLSDAIHDLGIEFPCGGKGICGNCKVKLLAGEIALSPQHRTVLERKGLLPGWRLACLSRVEEDLTIEVAQFDNIVLADETPFRFTPREGRGIAVDLGSTTIVSQLLDLSTGRVQAVQTDINPQARHGADIMSRISYAIQSEEHAARLTTLVRETVGRHVLTLTAQAPGPIDRIRIVGNSVMHHLFCGLDVGPLAAYPFESPDNGMRHFSAAELGWLEVSGTKPPVRSSQTQHTDRNALSAAEPDNANHLSVADKLAGTDIAFLPNIGSFVGSDILAGIYAAGMFSSGSPRVLIDLGTNGEIAVGSRNGILCASTAAGPAFEGSNISCGMRAATGAISSVTRLGAETRVHVIGNVEAAGICGSGLIDAIRTGVQEGKISRDGTIATPSMELPLTGKVKLVQKDIREFQLAKAAIATGVELLLREQGISRCDVEKVFIAGGFGNYIDLPNAIGLGLLEFDGEKIVKLSNSALIGAKMFLFEDDAFIDNLLPATSHLSLESNPAFLDVFCEKMSF